MASTWSSRVRFLLLAAVALLALNLGRQGYRWFAHADERAALARLTLEVEEVALALVRTQLLADSLRFRIEAADRQLTEMRAGITALERRADRLGLPPEIYDEYRGRLREYNGRIAERNRIYERWREVVARNQAAVEGYNAGVDSMRVLGARMGEPYLPVPTPAEVALRNGIEAPSRQPGATTAAPGEEVPAP